MTEKRNITIEEVWKKAKANFRIGKDYIESETDDYIVFSVFNYALLSYFNDELRDNGSYFRFTHCVCDSLSAFRYWYNGIYQRGRLKTFFIRRDIDLNLMVSEYDNPLVEFTGWIDFSDRNFLHFAHDVRNRLITGEYVNYKYIEAYSRKVAPKRKEDADFVNMKVSEVYVDLFIQYNAHVNELERTLYNIIE